VLQLRVFAPPPAISDVAECLKEIPGSRHVIRTPDGASDHALVTADLVDDAVDIALEQVKLLGVPSEDVALLRLDAIVGAPATARNGRLGRSVEPGGRGLPPGRSLPGIHGHGRDHRRVRRHLCQHDPRRGRDGD
jgi:hypothetical protein